MTKIKYLMCRPDNYDVEYEINPWMKGNIHRPDVDKAKFQWGQFHELLSKHADVEVLPQPKDVPDMVFAANGGFILNNNCIVANFRYKERQGEEAHYEKWFRDNGFNVFRLPKGISFEGAGDALVDQKREIVWAAYGFRTNYEAHPLIAALINHPLHSLRLVDPRFYHLDTCFAVFSTGHIMYYPAAFDRASQQLIETTIEKKYLIPVADVDALQLCCNCVEADGKLFLSDCSDELEEKINNTGLELHRTHLNQFHMAGGSNRCLVLKLDDVIEEAASEVSSQEENQETITIKGHLIDQQIMSRVCNIISTKGGSFQIKKVNIGVLEQDPSEAQIIVSAPQKAKLQEILQEILDSGADVEMEQGDAVLAEVEMNGVAPDDFYCTTIFPTEVQINGERLRIKNQRMDGVIAIQEIDGSIHAECKLMRSVRKGEKVVVGVQGVYQIIPSTVNDQAGEEFQFMGSGVSSERRVETAIDQIAWEMTRIKDRGGKIVVVAGPVVVHTGGTQSMCELIKMGYVQCMLGGNAIAVHDMERDLYGTSLGVDMDRGGAVEGGHRHHLRTINSVRREGSIADAVRSGMIRTGIMKTLVDCDVPFVLAGSIRDDGPLPDTLMDLEEAQQQYQEHVRGADMVLMLSSMLHSIGTGNMIPSGVRLVSVDINPAVATKLTDRGSLECIGLVTDVGLFLKLLVDKIKSLVSVHST